MHSYNRTFDDLPEILPIFPITGVLLLPGGTLPLNIFEPRYIDMIDDCMGTHRMIGMLQPCPHNNHDVYQTGCAGHIVRFNEANNNRYLITLTGICRFAIKSEIECNTTYRQIKPDWTAFENDMCGCPTLDLDRRRLHELLKCYFQQEGMSCDWDKMDVTKDHELLTALSMICPLSGREKQALLEAADTKTRTDMFITMLEMNIKQPCPHGNEKGSCH